MPTQKEVMQMATALHDKKLFNMEASTRDLLSVQSDILNGPEKVGWYVVGGSGYVLIAGQAGPEGMIDPGKIDVVKPAGPVR